MEHLERLAAVEDFSPPLTLGEALEVADQIRNAVGADRVYWAGVVEQLCKQRAARDGLLRRLVAAGDQFAIDADRPHDTSADIVWGDEVDVITREARKLLEGER